MYSADFHISIFQYLVLFCIFVLRSIYIFIGKADASLSARSQVEELTLPPKERQAYVDFEKAAQKDFIAVRHRLLHMRGSHTMQVLTLLSKFRQVMVLVNSLCAWVCCMNERGDWSAYQSLIFW